MRDDAQSTNAVTVRLFVYYFAALENTLGVQQYMIPASESFKYDITKIKGREILVSLCKWSRKDYLNTLNSELLCYPQEELRTNTEIRICFTRLLKS